MDSCRCELFQSVGAACGGVDGLAELVESTGGFFADAGGCTCDKCSLAHDGGVFLVIYNVNADSPYIVNRHSLYCNLPAETRYNAHRRAHCDTTTTTPR